MKKLKILDEIKKYDLRKELGLIEIFSIASGAMISSGLFILPGLAFAQAGPGVSFSYLLAGLLAMTGMFSQAELATAMPKAGGDYFYVTRTMGPAMGTLSGMLNWFAICFKTSFALVGMSAFTILFLNMNIHFIAISLTIIFTFLNIMGVKKAGRIQVYLVILLLLLLIFYIIRGFTSINIEYLSPYTPKGFGAIFSTAGFVFVSYGGLLKITSLAEEVKNPGKIIPIGLMLSLFLVTLLYFLVVFVTVGVLEPSKLSNSLTPISDGAFAFLGNTGGIILTIAALLAFITTGNAGIMAASRYPLALSRDFILPEFFSKVSKKSQTPYVSIIITGILIIGMVLFNLKILVETASVVLILTYLFSCLSIIILRESKIQNYRPKFYAPLYPYLQIAGIIGFIFLIYEMGYESWIICSIFIVIGLLFYFFYGRIRISQEYALLHLIERLTSKELTSHSLENELREIIKERDNIIKDRFDNIIESCVIIDIDESITKEALFKIASVDIVNQIGGRANEIYTKLIESENESSTVISPYLAIPHIVISGEKKFDIFLARSKGGFIFSENAYKVHAVFIIVGSSDERPFYLRALTAIAQIVNDTKFEKRWMQAHNNEGLRDIILLSKRKRKG